MAKLDHIASNLVHKVTPNVTMYIKHHNINILWLSSALTSLIMKIFGLELQKLILKMIKSQVFKNLGF